MTSSMKIFLLLLLIVPLVELYFLIQVGEVIGALPTVLLTVFTAVVGVALMRQQGLATVQTAQIQMASGESPQQTMMEGVFIFIGGVFLFFPGLISDAIGFLFLIPFVRRFLIGQSLKGFATKGHYRTQTDDQVFEGEWEEKPPQKPNQIENDKTFNKQN